MKGWTTLSSLALVGLLAGGAVASNDEPAAKVLFETKCSACHGTNRPLGVNKDRAGWERTVKRMQGKREGHLSDSDVETIVNYLTEIRGP